MTSEPGLGRIDEVVALADAYMDAGKYESAREVVSRSLASHPDDPVLLANYARAELALGNEWQAARSAHAALSRTPEDEFAMRVYALSLFRLGRHHDALWMAWRTVTTHPNLPEPLRLYALMLQKTWQLRSALDVIDQALRLDPQYVDAHIRRGSILHDMGRRAEAAESYRAALQLDPANATALNDLAVHRLQGNKLGRALQGFLGAARQDPSIGDLARRNIGVVLRKVLTGMTIGAGLVGVVLAITVGAYGDGRPTAVARLAVGLITAALIAALWWLHRSIPRGVLLSVLRKQHFSAARLVHAVVAIPVGAWVTVYPGPPAMIAVGAMLAISALVIIRIGLTIGK
ncbi:tetratricopeptide repeat protein [Mycobacterium sp. E2989]|uniref:tetratricopeptide repeat protein n=1 Tax=Mycobacterium sp. E2989 TaxID=1834140 RepID=UPI000AC0E794|nr:tetratricopeptide repeat protein [Mycobacterium sp. E2989]